MSEQIEQTLRIRELEAELKEVHDLLDRWDEIAGMVTYQYDRAADRLRMVFNGAVNAERKNNAERRIENLKDKLSDSERFSRQRWNELLKLRGTVRQFELGGVKLALDNLMQAYRDALSIQIAAEQECALTWETESIWCSE